MRLRGLAIALSVPAACALAFALTALWPLTIERANEQLGADPDCTFFFVTGVDPSAARCDEPADDGPDSQTATAIRVGWLARRCENGRVHLELTPLGRRLSSRWVRPPDPQTAFADAAPPDSVTWFVTGARFERRGGPQILPDDHAHRRVVVRGRWILSEDGAVLRAAGWPPLREPAVRDEVFERRTTGWYLVPRLLGPDIPPGL